MKFTLIGMLLLFFVGLMMAGNPKTAPIVLYVLALMILLLVLINYKQMETVLMTPT